MVEGLGLSCEELIEGRAGLSYGLSVALEAAVKINQYAENAERGRPAMLTTKIPTPWRVSWESPCCTPSPPLYFRPTAVPGPAVVPRGHS